MANINKLKAKIVENNLNIEEISELLGVNKSTFYRKLNTNGMDFTIKEVVNICSILNLTKKEAVDIFFD